MLVSILATLVINAPEKPAKRAFTEFEKALKAARSASGVLAGVSSGRTVYRETFLLQKPRSFRAVSGMIDIYSNGKTQFNHLVSEKEFFKTDVSKSSAADAVAGLDAFFGEETGSTLPYFIKRTEFRLQKVDGKDCAAKAIYFESMKRNDHMVFIVDRSTRMILGWDQDFGGTKTSYRFRDLKLNVKVPVGAFEWTPPSGVKEKVLNNGRSL